MSDDEQQGFDPTRPQAAEPGADPDAPFGRDEDGEPYAPNGYNANGKPARYRKYDWEEIRRVYVEGVVRDDDKGDGRIWKSMEEVSDLFEVPAGRVREHAAKEGWTEQRSAFQAHLRKVRQDKRAADMAKEATELDSQALRVSKLGLQLVTMRMGEIAKYAQHVQKERAEAGDDPDNLALPSVDSREMEVLSRAAMGWHGMGMKALGEVETTRTEVVGAGGGPVEMRQQISAQLTRDDPDRLYAFVVAMERAGVPVGLPGVVVPDDEDDELEEGDDQ